MPVIPANPAASAALARATSWSKVSRICGRKRLNSMAVMCGTVLAPGVATPLQPPAAEQARRTSNGARPGTGEESGGRPAAGLLQPECVAPQDGELLDGIVEVVVAVALDEPELGEPGHHGPQGVGSHGRL